MKRTYGLILLLLLVAGVCETHAETQAKLTVGASAFLDESTPFDHFVLGGAVRFYLSDRLSVEPEILYMKGPDTDRDTLFTGCVAYDVERNDRTTIYVIGGGGILRQTQTFPDALEEEFSSTNWAVTGGVGAQWFISKSVFLTSEFRMGLEPIYRISGGIGFAFDRK